MAIFISTENYFLCFAIVLGIDAVTCLFHITNAWGRKLKYLGFPMSHNPSYFVVQAISNIKELCSFDMNENTTYQLAMVYLAAQNWQAQLHLTPKQAEKFGQFFQYLHLTCFDCNSGHFVGKWSNYFPLISKGQFIVTNNANECRNSSLKKYFFNDIIDLTSLIYWLKTWVDQKNDDYGTFVKN